MKVIIFMDYTVASSQWKTVFAVPTEIVDQHIKVCGAASLRALMIVLRHGGQASDETVSSVLSMELSEVRDAMRYWIETGVLTASGTAAASEIPVAAEPAAPASTPEPKPVRQNLSSGGAYPARPNKEQINTMIVNTDV